MREHERGDESLAQSDFVVEERKKKTEEMVLWEGQRVRRWKR